MRKALALLRQPRWAVGAVLVLVVSALFLGAGLWQLDRLEQRRARNAAIAAAGATAAVPLGSDPVEFSPVVLDGMWTGREFLVPLQTRDGIAGSHVLSLLQTADEVVVVDRGWVALDAEGAVPIAIGEVEVTARVRSPIAGAPTGEVVGERSVLSARDPRAIGPEVRADVVLDLVDEQPPSPPPAPAPPRPPEITEGRHLLYAVQWFSFIAIAVVGYAVLVWRTSRAQVDDSSSG